MTNYKRKTKSEREIIYAIYKRGLHIGNQKSNSKINAIKSYLSAANYKYLLNDHEFLSKYSAKIAIAGVHYYTRKK